MICTLTMLAMIDWAEVEKTAEDKKAFKAFKARLDKIMVSGYYEFEDREDEENYLAQAVRLIKVKSILTIH